MTTPITDRAERCADYGMSVPAETCRDLERVANQLFFQLAVVAGLAKHSKWDTSEAYKALAEYEAMKKGTT